MERLLIVGSGSAAKRHLDTARLLLPQADIRVLRHRESCDVLEKADGTFICLQEALNFKPKAVLVANPAPFHVQVAREFLRIGCHVLIEKPLAHNFSGVREMLNEADKRHVTLQIGYNLRFLPGLKEFRRLIQAGQIGRILSIHAEVGQHLTQWRPGQDYRRSVSAQSSLGGGVLLELSHEIDYLRWICGEIKWVSAWTGKVGDLEVDVEDSAKLILGFDEPSLASGGSATVTMDFIRQDPTRFCHAVGINGSLSWNGLLGIVKIYRSGDTAWTTVYDDKDMRQATYVEEWKSFLNSIAMNSKPEVTGYDGLAVLKVVEAAKLSHQQKGLRIDVANRK